MNSPQPTIQAIIFDCFGVLYEDAFKEFIEHHTHTATEARHYYDLALASDRSLVSDAQFYAELAQLSGDDPAAIQRRLNDTSVLNRALVPFIERLRAHHYRIGLLSNADRAFLDHFLDAHEVRHLFDLTLASSETRYVKPQREIFELMLERLRVPAAAALFVDDSARNAHAATSYGLVGLHYQNPPRLIAQLHQLGVLGEQ
jgi:putative hydrolase of the HAD superfamily